MIGLFESFCGILTLLSAFPAVTHARTCYLTSGKEADSSYHPCFPDQGESPCCSLAKSNDVPNDICLTGGVCLVQDPYFRGVLRQGACTDSTWGSSQCPSYNTTSFNDTFYMIPCKTQGRGYWCASEGDDCCANAARHDMGSLMNVTVTAWSGAVSSSGSSSTASSETSTSSSTSTADSSNASNVADSTSNCGSKKDTAATIGVGVALGVCLLAALIVIVMQRRIYKKKMRNQANHASMSNVDSTITQLHRKSAYPAELDPATKTIQPVELR